MSNQFVAPEFIRVRRAAEKSIKVVGQPRDPAHLTTPSILGWFARPDSENRTDKAWDATPHTIEIAPTILFPRPVTSKHIKIIDGLEIVLRHRIVDSAGFEDRKFVRCHAVVAKIGDRFTTNGFQQVQFAQVFK